MKWEVSNECGLLLDIMFMGEDLMSMVIHGYDGNEGDEKEDEKNQPDGGKPQRATISKEQAKRILEAAGRKEKQVQEDLDKEKVVGTGTGGDIDW